MTDFFIINIDDKYITDDGNGGINFVSKEEATFFNSYEEAEETARSHTKDGWIIEKA